MARQPIHYPIGSISSGTMRPEDLIPAFTSELEALAKQTGIVSGKRRKEHAKLVREIETRMDTYKAGDRSGESTYYQCDDSDEDLESLFDALREYAAPYFYFGAHPSDGAEYGFWLSEDWDADFQELLPHGSADPFTSEDLPFNLKVYDLADVPKWFRGEVAEVNDHGNVTLWVKTSRSLREIWSVV